MELKGLTVNFLGDSITEGHGVSCKDAIYHAVLAKETGIKNARNYGISGTRFALQKGTGKYPWKERVDTNSFCERFDKMDDDADLVVVFGGTNDYGHGDAPVGEFNDRTPDTFYGACHYLFSGLVKKYLGKPVVIMTPLHRAGEQNIPGCKTDGDFGNLKRYVDAIREVAEYYSLPVLDLYATSGLQPEIIEVYDEYIPDGLHPNDKGHEIIAHKLKMFLQNI